MQAGSSPADAWNVEAVAGAPACCHLTPGSAGGQGLAISHGGSYTILPCVCMTGTVTFKEFLLKKPLFQPTSMRATAAETAASRILHGHAMALATNSQDLSWLPIATWIVWSVRSACWG